MEITTIKSGNIKASLTNVRWWQDMIGGEPNSVKSTTAAYAYVPLVYRATRLRAASIAKAEVVMTSMTGDTVKDWPFEIDPQEMLWRIEAAKCLAGKSCWTPVKRGAQIVDWEEINPFDISIREEKSAKDGTVIYFHQNTTGEEWLNAPRRNYYEMLYISEYNPQSMHLPGQSMAAVSLGDSGLLQYLQVFASKFFEGGAMPVTLLAMENVSDDERKRVENWFLRSATSIKNAFRVLGVRAGMIQPTNLTQPIKDLAIPELHNQARQNVAVGFEIPQTMLEDAANFATAVEHHQAFYEDVVMPESRKIIGVINRQVFAKMNMKMSQDFNKLSIFQVDEVARGQSLSQHYNVTNDVLLSYELAGYELTDEQIARLEQKQAEKEDRSDAMDENLNGNNQNDKQEEKPQDEQDPAEEDMKRWKRKSIKRVKDGKPAYCEFESEHITDELSTRITDGLKNSLTINDVVAVFEVPQDESGISEKLEKLINGLYLLTEGTNEPV